MTETEQNSVSTDVSVRTVTVSDTNTVAYLKDLVASIPLVHENMIKNSVSDLKLLSMKKYATEKVKHYIDTSIFNARKRKENK